MTISSSLPLASVVMAVRNGERFLEQAIKSVLAQDYRPLDIIVVDGQSTDATAQIAKSYPEVRYIYQETLGIANAYNLGIDSAHGEYIAFLSHDDLWLPTKLRKQITYLLEHPEVEYTIVKVKFFLQPGCAFPSTLRKELLEEERAVRIMETLVARRRVFDTVGRLDPAFSTAEDVDWYARAGDMGVPMAIVDEVLLHKRIHDTNTSVYSPQNMQQVFTALRRSAVRKREQQQEPKQ